MFILYLLCPEWCRGMENGGLQSVQCFASSSPSSSYSSPAPVWAPFQRLQGTPTCSGVVASANMLHHALQTDNLLHHSPAGKLLLWCLEHLLPLLHQPQYLQNCFCLHVLTLLSKLLCNVFNLFLNMLLQRCNQHHSLAQIWLAMGPFWS